MCIKVDQDEALRAQNRPRIDATQSSAFVHWRGLLDCARVLAGADAALLRTAADPTLLVCGEGLAPGLQQALAAMALRSDACGVSVRASHGEQACPDLAALTQPWGLQSLWQMHWRDGSHGQRAWLVLVNPAGGTAGEGPSSQLMAIAQSLREQAQVLARMRGAALLTQRLEDVARASGDWSWETDEHHRYTWVHGAPTAQAQPSVRPPAIGELIPSGLVVDWHGEPESPLCDFHAVLRKGEPVVRTVTREYAYGRSRYVSRSAVPLLNPDGSLRGFRGSARDVTQSLEAKAQLWQREKALQRAKNEAEACSQAKSMLVSKVGHELRTPLNAIVGLAQLIQSRALPEENPAIERWVAQIAKTGWHMVDVLDLLLETGRAGAPQRRAWSGPVDLVERVREAWRMVEAQAQGRSIRMSLHAPAPVSARVDPRAVSQVVVNLLSNAIKYNREGGWIGVRVVADEPARIEIEDNGPGLTEDQLARLYRPFDRCGAEASGVAGHGLGLVICKELVTAMGGQIQVRSTVGEGTTFSVLLPTAPLIEGGMDEQGTVAAMLGGAGRAAPGVAA
ncbi:sensor histidine kinase [Ideonella sp. BN130291]|uniref:sensor histidine kinase n=1 Tax=Ideonella sp. BN130291 TaxID=3112940 RepID=UPI002E25F5D2|nr:HAMP domain-containing sensor histidine kinase [Ideonella sp. BN130291]